MEKNRDAVRDAWLRQQGFVVLRFWNNDVLKNLSGVLHRIAEALRQPAPPSLTLPRKGGGDRPSVGGGEQSSVRGGSDRVWRENRHEARHPQGA
ncbi:MAG TPA: DUF559 domain-containing protein [Xanthobacteraceae bacterium]|nr:DUF559 domain-containing protein [Xanthobacteraceae bacterium]